MLILGLDSSGDRLALALVSMDQPSVDAGGRVLASLDWAMRHGHGERLPAALTELLNAAGRPLGEIALIGVCTGPGAFTGLRIGLAFAGGLALAGQARIVGVGAFDALEVMLPPLAAGVTRLLAIDSRREEPFFRLLFGDGSPSREGWANPEAILAALPEGPLEIAGSAAATLARRLGGRSGLRAMALEIDPATLARLAFAGRDSAGEDPPPPIYLRPPEATPLAVPPA